MERDGKLTSDLDIGTEFDELSEAKISKAAALISGILSEDQRSVISKLSFQRTCQLPTDRSCSILTDSCKL